MAGLLNRLAELTDEQLEEGTRTLSGIRTDIGQFYRAAMLMELDRRGKGIKGGPGSGDKPGHPFRGNQWTGGRSGGSAGGSAGDSSLGLDDALDVLTGKQPPNAATSVRKIDQTRIKSDSRLSLGGLNEARVVEIEEPDGTIGKYCFKPSDGEALYAGEYTGRTTANEVAASLIDEALGLGMVAKTEMAEIDGRQGSLQKWINDNAVTAKQLIEFDENGDIASTKKLEDVDGVNDMLAFDALIGNTDRHQSNWLVKDGSAKLIDNGFSMATNDQLARGYDDGRLFFRTLELNRQFTRFRPISEKFRDGLKNMLENKDQVDAKLKAAGVGDKQRDSFWKRAEHIRKMGAFAGYDDSALKEIALQAEGRSIY